MKLLKQKKLYFSEGKSDKVYEVDLCESSTDLFIVNFRYGRRGATLREGTKTVFPVSYEEALKVYDKLIASKEKKGYSESGVVARKPIPKKETIPVNAIREETILTYLKEATLGTYARNWKVSRIILRALHLNITSAVTYISHFITSNDEFEQYAAIYALSEFEDTSAINTIFSVFTKIGFENKVGRIAAAYLLKHGNAIHQATIKEAAQQKMPKAFDSKTEFSNKIAIYFLNETAIDAAALYYAYIYAYNDKHLSTQLYNFIQQVPLKINTFKSIRYIYRAAEMLLDIPFLSLVSKRIAISKPGYTSDYVYLNNTYIAVEEEKKKANPSIAFSRKTKEYFNKINYKFVYELSTSDETNYIRYATELLCSLDDTIDNSKENLQYFYTYNYDEGSYAIEKRYFPKYHNFTALMYIVYGGSTRLQQTKTKWYSTEEIDVTTLPREEVLPQLWDTRSQEVLHILTHAKSDVAIHFSLRIIKDNPQFLENIPNTLLAKLVSHYHPNVLEIVLNVLERKYKSVQPEETIIISLVKSQNKRAIQLALDWIKKYESNYFSTSDFLVELLLTNQENVLLYLQEIYSKKLTYNLALTIEPLEPLFETPPIYSFQFLLSVNQLIGETYFGKLLSNVSEEKIRFLANSNSVTNRLFAANLSKHNTLAVYQLFRDSLDNYINSEEEILRKVGIELLAHFPDEYLIENHQQISAYCFSEYPEVREAIQPSIERLLILDKNFKEKLQSRLLYTITEAESYEGLHQDSYTMLTTFYGKDIPLINQKDIISLILSNYEFAQKLGTPLFKERINLEDLTIKQIVEIANSNVLEIRELLHNYFILNNRKINAELEEALHIFNSDWQDVIQWSCDFFEKYIEPKNWTIDILLYLCDHTKKEVQAFGRKMITAHFSEDKGVPLLLKLQEHPTTDMQFFVSNYLNTYAKDQPEIILKLEDYFKTSLFAIHTNRATKTRIYAFLEQESIKNKTVATMTVRIINAILGTKTITDKSNNIDILLTIIEAHPTIEVPLTLKPS